MSYDTYVSGGGRNSEENRYKLPHTSLDMRKSAPELVGLLKMLERGLPVSRVVKFVTAMAVACAFLFSFSTSAQNLPRNDTASPSTPATMTSGDGFQPFPDQFPTAVPLRNGNNLPAETGRQGQASLDTNARALPGQMETRRTTNEFQKFLQVATGKLLPIFGENFFSSGRRVDSSQDGQALSDLSSPSTNYIGPVRGGPEPSNYRSFVPANNTFTPIQDGPVPSDYPLGPRDEILIRASGSIDIDYRTVIDRNGMITIPRVGTLSLVGVKASNVEEVIRAAVGKNYRGFQLNVTLGHLRAITIYVVGQARQPGTYTVSSLSTLVTAMFQSGGPNANGSLRRVEVRRDGKKAAEMDLYGFIAKGDKSGDVRLLDGDVIVIPPKGGQVALTGEVESPAIYELRSNGEDLRSLLDIAGGLPVLADPHRALLERIDPTKNQPRTVEQFALDEAGLAMLLKNGDMVTVLPITPTFANAITLRGSMLLAQRVPFYAGMRVTDLVPSKEFLVTKAAVRKQNAALLQTGLFGSIGTQYTDINWDYAVVERIKRENSEPALISFDLGKALADPAGPDNVSLLPGDTVTVFSADDLQIPLNKRHVYVSIEGEVKHPGVYQVSAGESLINAVLNAGGLTPDAYLFGAEFDRVAVRKAQQENLDKLLRRIEQQGTSESSRASSNLTSIDPLVIQARLAAEKDSRDKFIQRMREVKPTGRISLGIPFGTDNVAQLPGLRLENGDRLVVPSRPDFVQVVGSVNSESSMLWQPGKAVSDYLARAGLSRDSDKDALFVLRVDGTVVSNTGSWMSGVAGTEVYPGDSIVVPEKTDKESNWTAFTRYLKDYSTILMNVGLSAAAFKALGY